MGNPASKASKNAADTILAEANIPSSPILTRKLELDPRSPSTGIARTPIDTITSFYETSKDEMNSTLFETPNSSTSSEYHKELNQTPVNTRVSKCTDIRTQLLKLSSYNNITKNLQKQVNEDVTKPTLTQLSPKLLESSPVLNTVTGKRLSDIGLLETNFDYEETNIDSVARRKQAVDVLDNLPTCMDMNTPIKGLALIRELIDPRSPSLGVDRTPIQVVNKVADSTDPCLTVDKTPIQLKQQTNKCETSPVVKSVKSTKNISIYESPYEADDCKTINETVEHFYAENSIETEEDAEAKYLDTANITKSNPNLKSNLMKTTKQALIFEDAVCSEPNERTKPSKEFKAEGTNRTPLGVRNGPHSRSKSANGRLSQTTNERDYSKSNTKADFTVGKIPVFHKNRKNKMLNQQCENTPPTSMTKQNRQAHWDSTDNTMII